MPNVYASSCFSKTDFQQFLQTKLGKKTLQIISLCPQHMILRFWCERVFLMDRSSWPLCVRSTPGTEAVSGTRRPAAAKTVAALRGPSSSTLPTPPPRNLPFTMASRCQENPYQRRITAMTPRYSCDGDLFTGAALNCTPNKKGMRAALWRRDLLL